MIRFSPGWGLLPAFVAILAWATPAPSAPTEDLRTVPITLVTDRVFQKTPAWRGVARRAIELGTEGWAREVGLRFRVTDEFTWRPNRSFPTLGDALDHALEAAGPREGLVVVFTGNRPREVADKDYGFAYLSAPALIVLSPHDAPFAKQLHEHLALFFRHELGHVYGLPHLKGENVMNPAPELRADEFDPLSLEVLKANRTMDLNPEMPFEGSDLEALRDVYLIFDERGQIETALLVNLGLAFHRRGDLGDARKVLETALRRERHSVEGKLGLAQTLVAMEDLDLGRELVETLSGIQDLSASFLAALGELWMRLGELDRGEAFFDRAIAQGAEGFAVYYNRGVARLRREHFELAKADFETALDIEERPEGLFNLGLSCDALGDPRCAIRAFRRYLELNETADRAEEAERFLDRYQGQ